MEGARDAGAEVEFIDLYDRSLNYKGCMSCFACKVKGGRKGICSYKDDLQPVLEKAMEADVLVCGSPVYTAYPTANLRAFMERLIFPAVNYSNFRHPIINKPKVSATIYTMNCPNKMMYRANGYHITMDVNASQLGMFGPTELMLSYDTYQFKDYSHFDAAQIDAEHKAKVHERQFPEDLEKAYELGKNLIEKVKQSHKNQ
jgi:multimeric flavodoxin WrbA